MRKLNRKGISPVIATVIIVAVAIAIAIAVAYWVLGIVPAFTKYEELKITNAYINGSDYAILVVKNTGSADITITDIFVNGKGANAGSSAWFGKSSLTPGESATLVVAASNFTAAIGGSTYTSGVVYEFTIKTAAGGSYPVTARAP